MKTLIDNIQTKSTEKGIKKYNLNAQAKMDAMAWMK